MIIFAALTPHSPLLLDTIGKENVQKFQATRNAMQFLSEELYAAHPDVILIISSHRFSHPNSFAMSLHDSYKIEFTEFGDLSTSSTFAPDLNLMSEILRYLLNEHVPFNVISDAKPDYGIGVPLTLLTQKHKKPKIIPITYSLLSPKTHVQFGRFLKDVCANSKKRIAVVAAGDLSHTLSSDTPVGFNPAGEKIDNLILQAIKQMSISQLLSIDPELLEQAVENAYRPLLILFGMIEHMNVRAEVLSYEHPFGVGVLTTQFHLQEF